MYYFKDNAFYHPDIHDPIPAGAVEITDQNHAALMLGISNGETLSSDGDGNPILIPPTAIPLADVQQGARIEIDGYAEAARMRFLTNGAGQAMTYQEKSEQAADYVAAGYPADTSSYPFVQAEIEATGKTKEQAADDILTKKSEWIAVGSLIEKHRIGGKVQIDAATTPEEVQQIVDDLAALLAGV